MSHNQPAIRCCITYKGDKRKKNKNGVRKFRNKTQFKNIKRKKKRRKKREAIQTYTSEEIVTTAMQ
jgi:hypothetical protein